MKLINILTLWVSLSFVPSIVTAAPGKAKHTTSDSTSCLESQPTSRSTSQSIPGTTSKSRKTKRHSTTAPPTPTFPCTTESSGISTPYTSAQWTTTPCTTEPTETFTSRTPESTDASSSWTTESTEPTATCVPYVDGRLFNINGKTRYFAGNVEAGGCNQHMLTPLKGTNTWWLGHLFDDTEIEKSLSEIAVVSI